MTRLVHAADGTAAKRAELDAFDYLPREEQEKVAMAKLRNLLQHAFTNVPYYNQIARERDLASDDFKTYADLQLLPIVTKATIKQNFSQMLTGGSVPQGAKLNFTGGSTGQPLKLYQDASYRQYAATDKARCYERCNYAFGDPLVFLWGSDVDSAIHKSNSQRIFDKSARNLLWIDTSDLSENMLRQQNARIVAHRPVLMVGYAASMTLYARYIVREGLDRPHPRAIQVTAETLAPAERELLQQVFECEVFDRYGCRELSLIAHECQAHNGLHFTPLRNLPEVVDHDGTAVSPGAIGRVLVTNLNNYAMPFIRYEIGDLAVTSTVECSCGRATPLFERIAGRKTDNIVSPSGKVMAGALLLTQMARCMAETTMIEQYQVVQRTQDSLLIRLVPHGNDDPSPFENQVSNLIKDNFDPDFNISFEICDHIDTSASGKYRSIVSELETTPSN